MKPWLLAALAALTLCGLVLAIAATEDGDSDGRTYEIVFDNAFGLSEGGDFKVAGVRAGTTGDLRVSDGPRRFAIVTAEVTEPGFADLRRDARCEIRPQSFIGEYFVDCQPGSSDERIPDGGRVPVEQTSSTIPVDLVNNIVRRPYADRLRIIVGELGAGLAGRPGDLSEVLRRAHPGLRETNQTLRVLARQTRTIERVITDADTVVGELARRRGDVARFVREAGSTAAVAATRRDDLAASFDRLPAFLGELDPYMLRLGQLATAQQPVLRNLRASAAGLDTFLTRVQPFTEAGLPATTSLGDASVVGRRAVRATSDDLEELAGFAKAAPGLAKPLRQFLESTDDRRRAVEPDPRAAATDPPAPDKTHITGEGGFTGMEAVWDYFFWQALSTNALDDLGHVLRLNVSVGPCSGYFNHREGQEAGFDQCRQWLGPRQPGINEPEPTAAAASAAAPAVGPDEPVLDYLLGP
ncbi:MAG: MCE family protein [Thermoleophilaceae bacterium]|nr:MCE family protein [Thermoleophilaceae bacterium]